MRSFLLGLARPSTGAIPGAVRGPSLWDRIHGFLPASRQGVYAVVDQGIVSVTNFLTGVIVGRSCSREEFGVYALAFVVLTGMAEIQASLISTPYTVYRPRLQPEDVPIYNGSTLLLQLIFSACAGLVLAGAALAFGGPHASVAPVLAVLGAVIACMLMREHLRRVCFAALRMRAAGFLDALVGVTQITVLLLLARTGHLSARTAILAAAASSATMSVLWLSASRSQFRLRVSALRSTVRSIWGLGRWMSASGLLSIATVQVYPWMLTALHGPSSTALWAACSSVTSVVNPGVLALTNYLGPAAATAYAEGGSPRLRRIVDRVSLVYVAATAPFCVAMLFAGSRVVAVLYGAAYLHDGVVVSLLAFNLVPIGLSVVSSRGLFALERADLDFRTNLVPVAVAAATGFWLIGAYGAAGAAAASLTGNSMAALVRYVAFRRLTNAQAGLKPRALAPARRGA